MEMERKKPPLLLFFFSSSVLYSPSTTVQLRGDVWRPIQLISTKTLNPKSFLSQPLISLSKFQNFRISESRLSEQATWSYNF